MAGVYIILGLLLLAAIFFACSLMAKIDFLEAELHDLQAEKDMREDMKIREAVWGRNDKPPGGGRVISYSAPMVERAREKLKTRRGEEG